MRLDPSGLTSSLPRVRSPPLCAPLLAFLSSLASPTLALCQNGYAVLNACRELNSRLAPFREKLGPDAPMSALAGAAWAERVSLSATGHYATPNLGYVWNVQERTADLFACTLSCAS